jgi:hypothetical protein
MLRGSYRPQAEMPVDIIRHRAEHLGTVVAANKQAAIKAAMSSALR